MGKGNEQESDVTSLMRKIILPSSLKKNIELANHTQMCCLCGSLEIQWRSIYAWEQTNTSSIAGPEEGERTSLMSPLLLGGTTQNQESSPDFSCGEKWEHISQCLLPQLCGCCQTHCFLPTQSAVMCCDVRSYVTGAGDPWENSNQGSQRHFRCVNNKRHPKGEWIYGKKLAMTVDEEGSDKEDGGSLERLFLAY